MPPLSIMVKPASSLCNMRCDYCFYQDEAANRDTKSYGLMTEDTLETLVRRAMAYAEGSVSFAFQGGEPTLAGLPFYQKLAALEKKYNARGLKVQNAIQTNGYEMPGEMARFFKDNDFLIGVSLDGLVQTHDLLRRDASGRGTFHRVEETAQRLMGMNAKVNILCVVNGLVAREGREPFERLQKYRYLQFIPCLDGLDGEKRPYSLTAEDYAFFLNETFSAYYEAFMAGRPVSVRNFDNYLSILLGRQPENCAMLGRCGVYYLVESNGDVYPCDFYVLDKWRMGNIRKDSFFRLEKSPVAQAFRQASFHVDPACGACRWFGLCRGGCRREREPFLNGKPVLNRMCGAYKAFFAVNYSRLEKMAGRLRGR